MFLSAILEMCLLHIIFILKTCMRILSHTYSLFYSVNKPTLQLSTPDCPLWYTVYLFSGVVTPLFCLVFSLPSLFFKLPLPHEALHAIWWTESIREILAGQASEKQKPLESRCTAQFFLQSNVLGSHYLFAEVISPVQYPVGGSVCIRMDIRAEWHRYKRLWIKLSGGFISYLTLGHGCLLFHP